MHQPLLSGHEQFLVNIAELKEFPAHWHSEIEIVYCMSGSFDMKINRHDLSVKSGQAVFVSSTEEHEYLGSLDGNKVLVIEVGISFLGAKFSELAKLQFTSPLIDMDKPEVIGRVVATKFKEAFHIIKEANKNLSDSVKDEWETKGALFNIAALTLKYIPHKNIVSEKRRARMQALLNIQPAFSYIINNYYLSVTLDDVAKVTGYEKSNFCKQFKSATQTSFHKYLNTYRIGVACNLIKYSEYSMQAVGEKVGIPEAKSFSRIFRQVVGMTPTEYKLSKEEHYER